MEYKRGEQEAGMNVVFVDIKRAYMQAEVRREEFVALPEEDAEEGRCA